MSVTFPGLPQPPVPPSGATMSIDQRYRNPPLAEPKHYSYRVNRMPDYAPDGSWILNDENGVPHTVQIGDYIHWTGGDSWTSGDYDAWRLNQRGVGEWVWEGKTPKYPVYYENTDPAVYYARHHIDPLVEITPFPPMYGLPGNPVFSRTLPSGAAGAVVTILNLVEGFIRLTGPDGEPGGGNIPVWGAGMTGPTGGPFIPDIAALTKVAPDGSTLSPQPGHLVFTNNEGDIKLWQVGPGGTTKPLDLPDGPPGPPGSSTVAPKHVHDIVPLGTLSYSEVRDRFAHLKYKIDPNPVVVP